MNFSTLNYDRVPSGIWKEDNLVGGKAKINSIPVSEGDLFGYSCEIYEIAEIISVIDENGCFSTKIRLKGLDKLFNWEDLEIVRLINLN